RELVRARAEQLSLDADPVAEIEQLVDPEIAFRHRVLPDVDLDLRAAVRDHEKVRLAERADPQNAPARDRLDPRRLELVVRMLPVRVDQLGDRVAPLERARVDLDAELHELREVRAPLLDLFRLGRHKNASRTQRLTADTKTPQRLAAMRFFPLCPLFTFVSLSSHRF